MIADGKQGGPQIALFLKLSFSKFSFLSIRRCIVLAECYSKRGAVLRPEGGVRDDAVALTGSGSKRARWKLH